MGHDDMANGDHCMFRKLTAIPLAALLTWSNVSYAVDPAAPPAAPGTPDDSVRTPMIEVSVDSLEISETNSKQIGINWGQIAKVDQQTGERTFNFNRLNFLETGERYVSGIFKIGDFNRAALAAQLQALEQNNQLRVLANPTLLTKSGFEATFLVGGEIPYPTPAPVGQAPGVEFKKYGVILKILPNLTSRGTIEAQINVGVSNPDDSVAVTIEGTRVPGLAAREASSKVEISDGETVVLSGIKQSRRSKIMTRVPILGYIPILGLLFRSKEERVEQISLVQFVTFRLIK